jgi:hypothetical protein
VPQVMGDPESPVGVDGIDQPAALRGAGLIEESDPDVPHIGGDHVAENNQLDKRGNDQQGPVLFIPEKLDEFLSYEFTNPQPTHIKALPF